MWDANLCNSIGHKWGVSHLCANDKQPILFPQTRSRAFGSNKRNDFARVRKRAGIAHANLWKLQQVLQYCGEHVHYPSMLGLLLSTANTFTYSTTQKSSSLPYEVPVY